MTVHRTQMQNAQDAEMTKQVRGILPELLFPKRCPFCDEVVGFAKGCAECEPELRRLFRRPVRVARETHEMSALDAVFAGCWYEGDVRDAIKRLKFAERTDLAYPLAALAAQTLRDAAAEGTVEFDVIVPVASSGTELRERGYDVPKLLAQRLARETGRPVLFALDKVRETQRQRTLSGAQRRQNVKGAFGVKPTVSVRDRSCLVVDDVFTTGATMNECAKMLKEAGAKRCIGLAIAVTR